MAAAAWKQKEVAEFAKLLGEHPIVGVVNISNLPAPQFQKIRASLRDKVMIKVGKRKLMHLAIEEAKRKHPAFAELEPYLADVMPALLFTKDNPFMLAKLIRQNASAAPAKAGQIAPHDIWVKAGPTPFAPGPIIGQLGGLGIKTAIEGGKIKINQDTLVVHAGKVVSADAASLLLRLGITPMEIGLDLRAVYENGEILTREVLFVDEEAYNNQFREAASWAFNLAFHSAYTTKETTPLLLAKAFADARALAVAQDIVTPETAGILFAKAQSQAAALSGLAKIEQKEA